LVRVARRCSKIGQTFIGIHAIRRTTALKRFTR
jgi:hypothetical protein